jgi:pimeloyl-ACP methyl ester carboxylesterase
MKCLVKWLHKFENKYNVHVYIKCGVLDAPPFFVNYNYNIFVDLTVKLFYRILLWLTGICAGLYIIACAYFYFSQEKLIFQSSSGKLTANFTFKFNTAFKEYYIPTPNGDTLNGVLFNTIQKPKGLIFYLHGNGGSIYSFSHISKYFNNLGYDVFILDYPGFGKSSGHISSQQQLFNDVKIAYNFIKPGYPENHVVIIGYSIGSGIAAWLAAQSHPEKLILLAPYYSFTDLLQSYSRYLPGFLVRYPIPTYQYIQHISAPLTIFHGDKDETIYYGSSLKLKKYFKPGDSLIILKGQTHNTINENKEYKNDLKRIL